ncbi:hypothetical protein SDC9_149399 [bioreactor metagenome]|uniref:Uncharacterized protein n=1 Tax=bioreactor metagenome TaxID=1076179 RepID=A0A645EJH7_9ZZZZ
MQVFNLKPDNISGAQNISYGNLNTVHRYSGLFRFQRGKRHTPHPHLAPGKGAEKHTGAFLTDNIFHGSDYRDYPAEFIFGAAPLYGGYSVVKLL